MNFELIVDNRESVVYDKLVSLGSDNFDKIAVSVKPLPIGDFVLSKVDSVRTETIAIFERKSLKDLLSSIKDGRYEEQSYRLTNTAECHIHNIIYVIEGMYSTLSSPKDKPLILSTITSLSHFKGFSVIRTCSVQETAEFIAGYCKKVAKEYLKGKRGFVQPIRQVQEEHQGSHTNLLLGPPGLSTEGGGSRSEMVEGEPNYVTVVKKVKKDNVTKENIGEIILSQIPGISDVTAKAIMTNFDGSIAKLMEELRNPESERFANIVYMTGGKTRRINKTAIESIRLFLRD
jgi:ERCC4-type nuclease